MFDPADLGKAGNCDIRRVGWPGKGQVDRLPAYSMPLYLYAFREVVIHGRVKQHAGGRGTTVGLGLL